MALFVDLADHIAVRKILRGVEGQVEGQVEPVWPDKKQTKENKT
jgi:hypothetical protein